jgi:hypothetical protein
LELEIIPINAVFNTPDMCVVGSVFIFLIISIFSIVFPSVKYKKTTFDPSKKLALFIDTTQFYCNLALIQDKKYIKTYSIKTNNNLTDMVVSKISKLLESVNVKKEQITDIYLVVGPGSFTGVRVGTIIAKT